MAFPGLQPPKKPRRHWKAKAISLVLLLIGIRIVQVSAFALIWPPTQLEMNRPDRDALRQTATISTGQLSLKRFDRTRGPVQSL